jgi:hypothetical protein
LATHELKTETLQEIDQLICECCTDDCGFDPESESKDSLIMAIKNIDTKARKAVELLRRCIEY